MNLDFNLSNDKRFIARASAIIYNEDKTKVLIFKIEGNDYYMLPGGRIGFGEDSQFAIKREIKEEVGLDLDFNLISIQENFLNKKGKNIMQYAFCYSATYKGIINDNFRCLDNDCQIFYWIDIKDIDKYNIVPKSTINLIKNKSDFISHNIEKEC